MQRDSVLVFFCVGTTTLIAILRSLTQNQFIPPLDLIAQSFPAAAPFYVGWRACFSFALTYRACDTDAVGVVVFQAGMGGLELGLYGLPLLVYPGLRVSATLRRRETDTRPILLSFYCASPLPSSVGADTYLVGRLAPQSRLGPHDRRRVHHPQPAYHPICVDLFLCWEWFVLRLLVVYESGPTEIIPDP